VSKRYYTLDEVNQLLPTLQAGFGRVMQIRAQLKTLYRSLDARGFAPTDEHFAVVLPGAPPDVVRDRASFKGLVETLKEELSTVQSTGCMIKDIETGLVDWFAEKDGREVFLCWRFGEPEVGFWHDLDSGYGGRRPVSELAALTPPEPQAPRVLH
jgi:hypothetical protein